MQSAPGAPRCCGARTRAGTPCATPAMANGRCRMHGGLSPGAPKGNRNAVKHGHTSAAALARRREVARLVRAMRMLAAAVPSQRRWAAMSPAERALTEDASRATVAALAASGPVSHPTLLSKSLGPANNGAPAPPAEKRREAVQRKEDTRCEGLS